MNNKVLKIFKVKTSASSFPQKAAQQALKTKKLGGFPEKQELTFDLEQKNLSTLIKERLTPNGINLLDSSGLQRLQSALNSLGYGPIIIGEEFASKDGLKEIEKMFTLDASTLRNSKLSQTQLSIIKYQLNQSNLKVSGKPDFQTITLIIKQLTKKEKNTLEIINSPKINKISENSKEKTLKITPLKCQEAPPSKIGPKIIKIKTNSSTFSNTKSSPAETVASNLWKILRHQDVLTEKSSQKYLSCLVEAVRTPGKLKEVCRAYKTLEGKSLGKGWPTNSGSLIHDLKQVQASSKFLSQVKNLLSSSS